MTQNVGERAYNGTENFPYFGKREREPWKSLDYGIESPPPSSGVHMEESALYVADISQNV